jgi:hypothetical protein
LGPEPLTRKWDGNGDPLYYVISKNLHRRHLNESQRAMVADKIANMKRADTLKRGTQIPDAPIGATGQRQAAEKFNVSRRTIQKARLVQAEGKASRLTQKPHKR